MLRIRSLISLAPLVILACTSKSVDVPADKPADKPEVKPAVTPNAAKPDPDAKPEPGTEPGDDSSSAFGFGAVMGLTGGSQWSISAPVRLPDDQRDAILDGNWDGVTKRLDPKTPGLTNPFDLEASVTLVTFAGQFQRKITGLGIESTMDNDMLYAILGPVEGELEEEGAGIAVIGSPVPSPTAKLRHVKSEPPSAELLAELTAEFDGQADTLIAGFKPYDEADYKPTASSIRPTAACVEVYRAELPAGFDGVVTVGCGGQAVDEAKLKAMFLVGPGKRQPLTQGGKWSVGYSTVRLDALVDLDDDGVDELVLVESGYEYYEVSYMGWKPGGYAELPGLAPAGD